jgi:hypothetical protein
MALNGFPAHQPKQGFFRFLNPGFVNLLGVLRPVLAEREVALKLE